MTDIEAVNQIVDYKYQILHLKRLLSDIKTTINLYKCHNKEEKHFDRVWEELVANGVKDIYDSLEDMRNYMRT